MNETMQKPEPSVGQVWTFAGDAETGAPPGGPWVVRSVNAIEALFDGGTCAGLDWMRRLPAWRCVLIETPAGRVMVGERRQDSRGQIYTVLRIHEGVDPWRQTAERVASWPLAPPAESKPDALPMAPAPKDTRADRGTKVPGHYDEREHGPGVARFATPKPTVTPDMVHTWEAWTIP